MTLSKKVKNGAAHSPRQPSLEILHLLQHSKMAGNRGLVWDGFGMSADPTQASLPLGLLLVAWSPSITAKSPALALRMRGASPPLPCICHTVLYQTCKPLGVLWALNFYEILGPVIVRQTEGLVTDSSFLADAKASQHDAWFPRGQPSSVTVEINEDGTYPGKINTQEQ